MNYFQIIANNLSLVLIGVAIGIAIATKLIKLENRKRAKVFSTNYIIRAFTVDKHRTYGGYGDFSYTNYFWFQIKEPGKPDTKIFMSEPEWDKFKDGQILYMTVPYEA